MLNEEKIHHQICYKLRNPIPAQWMRLSINGIGIDAHQGLPPLLLLETLNWKMLTKSKQLYRGECFAPTKRGVNITGSISYIFDLNINFYMQ